jgi:hypothetical protein
VFNELQNKRKLTFDQVLNIVTDYTLQPSKQRDTWFKTEALYDTFVNEIKQAEKNEQSANDFVIKYTDFIKAMNKKTFDLFFSLKHSRSFYNNKAYNEAVKVTTIYSGKNIDTQKSIIEVK